MKKIFVLKVEQQLESLRKILEDELIESEDELMNDIMDQVKRYNYDVATKNLQQLDDCMDLINQIEGMSEYFSEYYDLLHLSSNEEDIIEDSQYISISNVNDDIEDTLFDIYVNLNESFEKINDIFVEKEVL
ncbi:hypothetical protein [Tetragenococcus phage phiWJ7]|nr:hypothetical protein [Tetragenococcus phage phiWJ7]